MQPGPCSSWPWHGYLWAARIGRRFNKPFPIPSQDSTSFVLSPSTSALQATPNGEPGFEKDKQLFAANDGSALQRIAAPAGQGRHPGRAEQGLRLGEDVSMAPVSTEASTHRALAPLLGQGVPGEKRRNYPSGRGGCHSRADPRARGRW